MRQPDFLSMSDLQERCSRCELNSTLDNDTALLLFTEECNAVCSPWPFERSVQNYSSAYCAAAKSAVFNNVLLMYWLVK